MANKKNINDEKDITKTSTNKEEKKEMQIAQQMISRKNIFIILGIILLLIILAIFIYRWQTIKNEEKWRSSYLISSGTLSLEIKNLDEIDQILSEPPTEYFVLITYTENEETYNLEVNIKDIIDKYKLSDSFYYLNVQSIMDQDNYLTRLNNAFNTDQISTVPIILYYKDGKLINTVTRNDNNIIKAGDFQKLLDSYEYEGQ